MTTTATSRFFDINTEPKPQPPPGLPTLSQRIKAMQLAARNHTGFVPKGATPRRGSTAKYIRQLVLPPEPLLASGKIPDTIVIAAAPEIHFEYNDDSDDDQTNEELSLSSNCDVFRLVHDDDPIGASSKKQEFTGTVPRPFIQRSGAFASAESNDSGDDATEKQSIRKSSRPRSFSGFLASFYRPKESSPSQGK